MPTGSADSTVTVPATAFPPAPASTARAEMSTHVSPAESTASSVVSKRTPSAVMQTVPFAMGRSAAISPAAAKRSVPCARSAGTRVRPRVSA